MIDDLDLAWEEQYDSRRQNGRRNVSKGRGRGKGRGRDRGRRRRSFGALFISFIMLLALGAGVYYGVGKLQDFLSSPDYTSTGTTKVTVQVNEGDSLTDIGNTLFQAGVVKSAKAFVAVAKADPRGKNIQVGYYQLYEKMPAKDALALLLDPDKSRLVNGVTIPEGMITIDIYAKLSKALNIPVANFTAAAKDPAKLGVPAFWFNRQDGKKAAKTSLEGFLFPDTYEFPPGATADVVLKQMVQRFLDVTTEIGFVDAVQKNLSISPYEALIAASISQAEAVLPEDFPKVTRVLYNRVYGDDFPCTCLQLDSTVNYYLRITGKKAQASEHLTEAQLHDPKDPYNTRDVKGMPVGPISNPGKLTLQGAMNPARSGFMFFVTVDKKGTMAYATTFDQHQQNIQLACKNGIPIC